MAPQDDLTAERAAAIKLYEKILSYSPDPETLNAGDDKDFEAIRHTLKQTRQEALREIRQVCVDYEDCCVLGLAAHGDKAVTNASIGAIQFIRRHIDDRLASEGA